MKRKIFITLFPTLLLAYQDHPPMPAPGKIDEYHENRYERSTKPAGPRVASPADIFFTGDFIYWRADQEGLGFATSGWRASVDQPVTKGKVTEPNFEFNPGFKAGFGVNLNHDFWDVYFQYTWLYTGDQENSITADTINSPALAASWFSQGNNPLAPDFPLINNARGRWALRYQTLDFELGRNFFVSDWLTVRPFFGLKGMKQDQDFSIRYRRILGELDAQQWRITQDLDYWGVGPRTGMNTNWFFSKHVSVFGDIGFSALWGQFEAMRRDRFANIAIPALPETTLLYTENEFHTITPVLEIGLGLRAQAFSCAERFHYIFQAGWEFQYVWDMNQYYRIYEATAHGGLSLMGLTIKLRVDF